MALGLYDLTLANFQAKQEQDERAQQQKLLDKYASVYDEEDPLRAMGLLQTGQGMARMLGKGLLGTESAYVDPRTELYKQMGEQVQPSFEQLDPTNADSIIQLGSSLMKAGDFERGSQLVNSGINLKKSKKSSSSSTPQFKELKVGDELVTYALDPNTNEYKEVGRAPRWQPKGTGSGSSAFTTSLPARKELAKLQAELKETHQKAGNKADLMELDIKFWNENVAKPSIESDRINSSAIYNARTLMNLLDSGLKTGFTEPWKMQGRRVLQSIGFDVDEESLANAEAFTSYATKLAMRHFEQTKGAITERENKMFLSIEPELKKSVGGNKLLLQMTLQAAEIARREHKEMIKWAERERGQGRAPTPAGWSEYKDKWLKQEGNNIDHLVRKGAVYVKGNPTKEVNSKAKNLFNRLDTMLEGL